MLLLIVVGLVNSAPTPSIKNEKIDNVQHRIQVNEQLRLYENIPNLVGINIYRRDQIKDDVVFTEEDFQKLQQEELLLEGEKGCISSQRSFKIDPYYNIRIPNNASIFYTDLLIVQNRALIIRNDFQLSEVNLFSTSIKKTNTQRQIKMTHNQFTFPLFLHNPKNRQIYIISEQGGVAISDSISLSENNFYIETDLPFQKRRQIYNVFLNEKIYVAAGSEGVDVYSYEDSKLKYESSLKSISNSKLHIYLNAYDIGGNQDYLFILDHQYGLLICDYNFTLLFTHSIQQAHNFDFYKNTFFIVAEAVTKQDFVIEVFVNFTDQTSFNNMIYIDSVEYFDLRVYEKYALLIGNDVHQIVYHSVYRGFINPVLANDVFFNQYYLYEAIQWQDKLITLSRGELRTWIVTEQKSNVICSSSSELTQIYQVYLNISQENKFELLKKHHAFQLYIKDNSIINKENIQIVGIIFLTLIACVWIGVIVLYLLRRKNVQLLKIENQTKKLVEEVSRDKEGVGMELTQV
ncbi:hypothetical protein pb186bvf_011442 [Paramecium bursaria]